MISYNGYINDYNNVKCVIRYQIKSDMDGLVVPSDSPRGRYNSFYRTQHLWVGLVFNGEWSTHEAGWSAYGPRQYSLILQMIYSKNVHLA
jgi:hypothetical protein